MKHQMTCTLGALALAAVCKVIRRSVKGARHEGSLPRADLDTAREDSVHTGDIPAIPAAVAGSWCVGMSTLEALTQKSSFIKPRVKRCHVRWDLECMHVVTYLHALCDSP